MNSIQANQDTTTSGSSLVLNTIPAIFREEFFGIASEHKVAVEEFQVRVSATMRAELGKAGFTPKKAGIVKVSRDFIRAKYGQQMESGNLGGKNAHPAVKFAVECDMARTYSATFPDVQIPLSNTSREWLRDLAERIAKANAEKAEAEKTAEAEKVAKAEAEANKLQSVVK